MFLEINMNNLDQFHSKDKEAGGRLVIEDRMKVFVVVVWYRVHIYIYLQSMRRHVHLSVFQ